MPSFVSILLIVPTDLRNFPLGSLSVSPGQKVVGVEEVAGAGVSLKYQFHSKKAAPIGGTLTFN